MWIEIVSDRYNIVFNLHIYLYLYTSVSIPISSLYKDFERLLFKLDLEKAEEPEINCQHPLDCWKSEIVPKKHLLLLHWLCQSLWLCRSQQTVENSSRDGNTRPPDLPPEESVCRLRSSSYNWTWNNRLVPNRERVTSRLYIVTLLI